MHRMFGFAEVVSKPLLMLELLQLISYLAF
jgi:hypothetical protein